MQAQKIAFFIFALVVAGGIINGSGIFTIQADIPDADLPGRDLADGIYEMDESTGSTSDLTAALDGWQMVLSMLSTIKTMFGVLVLPYYYLTGLGFNESFSLGIQSMITLVEAWGVIQFITNRQSTGME